MEATSPEQLLAYAKTQLGLSIHTSDSYVPKVYLDELKLHLSLYPHDTNFRVTLEPRRGLGKVTCLEQGCGGLSITLVRRVKVHDGGRSDGLGSLSAYRYHIAEHPTHARSRLTRVKAEKNGVSDPVSTSTPVSVKMATSSLLNLLDGTPQSSIASGSGAAPTSTPFHPTRRVSSLIRVKPEPIDARVPQKRLSDIAFGSDAEKPSDKSSFPPAPLSKKLKAEAVPKTPLSLINRNTGSLENVQASQPPSPPPPAIEDIRAQIGGLQTQISTFQNFVDRLTRKRKKSKADLTRMANYVRQIEDLRRRKDELNSSIPSMSPMKRTFSRPHILYDVKAEGSLTSLPVPPAFHSLYSPQVVQNVKAEARHIDFPAPALHNPIFGPPVVKKQEQPVASGSNIPLQTVRGTFGMDTDADTDDGENDYDPYRLPAAVLERIGPIIPHLPVLQGANHHDENGDFHGRGRDLFVGPQAKADDIDKFLLEAGNAEQFDGNASVDQALEKLGLRSQYDLLPGMEVALMPHQTIGVAWMLEKEQSTLKGGCLGDDMGLGKTVQMIAVLVKNRSEDPICKTNLIIAPTALLDQWKLEIEMKTNCDLKCLIYHGASKPKRKQELLKYDVILTTYSTMALEWPDFEAEQKKKEKAKRKKVKGFVVSDSDEDSGDLRPRKRSKESGLLFQVDFYRVILDEAQAVRNRRTRTSRAVTSLRAKYRWCLTGTPIINSLVDVYGYVRFLKIRPWYDFQEFQRHIGIHEKKNPSLAVSRLQAVITTFLLRRMKDSLLDGKRLIELPDKTISLVKLEFSAEEREIYTMVEARTQANFNRFLRAGTVLKNYSQVLVLLLRLRQICSHPSLIQEDSAAFIAPDGVDDCSPEMSTELTRARRLVSPDFVSKMKAKFKAAALQRMEAEKESADAVIEDEECPICFDVLTNAVITPCTHIFCRDCLVDVLNTPFNAGPDEPTKFKAHERPCPSCRSPICSEKLFTREAFQPSDKDLAPGAETPADVEMSDVTNLPEGSGKGKGVKRKRATRKVVLDSDDFIISEAESEEEEGGEDMDDFIVQSDEDEEEKDAHRKLKKRFGKRRAIVIDSDDEIEDSPEDREVLFGAKKASASGEVIKLMPRFLPSTKMKFMMEQLEKLMKECPDEKTLIVSQWTGCLQLVSDYLTEAGVVHVKYQGDMNRSKRDQAVRVFMSKDKARVMLMSLKCGGVGLNLTRANNVISLDLGWSQAIEAQSFDRVHRLGQTRPVAVQRLVIADTVEDRVLTMQERKQTLADGSLGEGSGKKIGRLSVKELAALFGLDHRGRLLTN